jgi:hypothetical protein
MERVYVFVRLHGSIHPVGRFEFVSTQSVRSASSFFYGGSWRRDEGAVSFPLDPVNLPLRRGPFTESKRAGLFGPLADATPDAWGRPLSNGQKYRTSRGLSPMEPNSTPAKIYTKHRFYGTFLRAGLRSNRTRQ